MSARAGGVLARHGRRMARFRWVVIPVWIAALVVAVMLAGRVGDVTTSEATLPGTEGQRGVELIQQHFAQGGDYTEVQPVFRNPDATVDDPAYRAAVEASLARAAKVIPGTEVTSYYSTGSRDMVGQDGHMTFATLRIPLPKGGDIDDRVPEIRAALGTPPGFEKTLTGGDAADSHDMDPIVTDDLAKAEMIVLPVALLVLLIFFGSLVGALIPLFTAIATVMFAMAATYGIGQLTDIAEQALNVIVLVGIGIGIDYALLIVSRFRDELRATGDRVEATSRAIASAGRAVLLSGTTVAIGLAVLVALPVPFMRSLGLAGMMVPLFAVFTALTALPAVLAVLGGRVDAVPVYPRRWRLRPGAFFGPFARVVTARAVSVPVLAIVVAGLAVLALQFPNMNTNQDSLADSPDTEAVQAGRLIAAELGGAADPNVYVIDTGRPDGVYTPQAVAALNDAASRLRAESGVVSGVTWPAVSTPEGLRAAGAGIVDPTGRYALMSVAPLGDPVSDSGRALNGLMERGETAIEHALPGSTVTLTGAPAMDNDFNDAIYGPFPFLVAGVLLLTFLALWRSLKSWVIPLISVLITGLSLLATYGLLYLVFMKGYGADLVGMDHDVRGIANWVPMMVFAFLFGISMDYQVFLVERMRELRAEGHANADAVRLGLRHTGRVIVTAAVVMVVAFAGFALGQLTELKEFGVALAAAIAIDAFVIRLLLVPALMRLVGERNWSRAYRARRRPVEAIEAR
ncbi:MAG: MMPL family transporter [Thermoleophilia bacterium]